MVGVSIIQTLDHRDPDYTYRTDVPRLPLPALVSSIAGVVAGEPYLVCKDSMGRIRAFYNVCRHHGSTVEGKESGTASCFKCPYHGWTYSLDGRLTRARKLVGIKDFEVRDFGLKPIASTTWGPFVFINLGNDSDPRELQRRLEPLKTKLDAIGFSTGMSFVCRQSYRIDCNWKICVDNYLDGGYHIEFAHKQLADMLSLKEYTTKVYDGYSIQSVEEKDSDSESDSDEKRAASVIYAHIYPAFMINRYDQWLDFGHVIPVGHDKCEVIFDWFVRDGVYSTMDVAKWERLSDDNIVDSERVHVEDIGLCERVQTGIKSASFEGGRYAPMVEQADYDFHVRLANDYRKYLQI